MDLYPADANGEPILTSPIWQACVNGFSQDDKYSGVVTAASGDAFETDHVTHSETELRIDRTWILRRTSLAEFVPQPATQYVLLLTWTSDGVWYRRTFQNVTPQAVNWTSRGVLQFTRGEQWRSARWTDTGGALAPPVFVPTVPAEVEPDTKQAAFMREKELVAGEPLRGDYRWAAGATLTGARITCAPGVGATVLRLEVNGSPTATTITLGDGAITATGTFNIAVPADQVVRWLVDSCPAPGLAPYDLALEMDVRVASPVPVGWFRETPTIAGEYLLGYYRWEGAMILQRARLSGVAGQVTPAVLRLEVGGELTATTITMPAGTDGQMVTVDATLNVNIAAGVTVRWLIDSCPGPAAAPFGLALIIETANA